MQPLDHLYALVMAGGSGTRFWPASRRARPKQLLPIAPGTDETLLESTIRRILPLCPASRILVVTGEPTLAETERLVAAFPGVTVVAEPIARNTAPCIGWGTALLARRDPEALVMALPSDHHIRDEVAFRAAIERAVGSARGGVITTLGMTPSRAETGYGHIEAVDEVLPGVRRAIRFVEKPDQPHAEEYARSGRYFWNSGMFFYRAGVMLEAIAQHLPDLAAGLARIEAAARGGAEAEASETRLVFPALPSVSIDYGVMEKVTPVHVVPADFGWSDLGSWRAAWELGVPDASGNVAEAATILVDSSGNLVRDLGTHKRRVIALVGVQDLCVIETDDALLVIPRERAQDVRQVVEELRRRGLEHKL